MKTRINLSLRWKKILVFISLLFLIFAIDYGVKVYELSRLDNLREKTSTIYADWMTSYKEDYEANAPTASGWTDSTEPAFNRFVESSITASGEMLLLATETQRSHVLPWHNDVQFAYQDNTKFFMMLQEWLESINWEYDSNNGPTMNFDSVSGWEELGLLSDKSFSSAKPKLKLLERLYDDS